MITDFIEDIAFLRSERKRLKAIIRQQADIISQQHAVIKMYKNGSNR